MILYIVRHAWAEYHGDPRWTDDTQRPLTDKGRERFAKVVELLGCRNFLPQVVATSPYVRCCETAEILAQVCPSRPEVTVLDDLAPVGDFGGLLSWTASQSSGHDQIAWVGHAPDVGHLAAALIGNNQAWIRFAKGAVAAIEFKETVELGQGELLWMTTAKTLGC